MTMLEMLQNPAYDDRFRSIILEMANGDRHILFRVIDSAPSQQPSFHWYVYSFTAESGSEIQGVAETLTGALKDILGDSDESK